MSDIHLLIKALTKGEMIDIIKQFGIPIQGFAAKVNRAPINLLKSGVKYEIESGIGRQRRRGRKYTTIEQVYAFLVSKQFDPGGDLTNISLEELAAKAELDKSFSKAIILSLLRLNFFDFYEKNKSQLEENIEKDIFIFTQIFEETSVEEKVEKLNASYLDHETNKFLLEDLKGKVQNEIGEETFSIVETKVNKEGESSFLKQMIETKTSEISMLAFLLQENRYKQSTYQPMMMHLLHFYYEREITNEKEIKKTLNNQYLILQKENKQLKQALQTKEKEWQKKVALLNDIDKAYRELLVINEGLESQKKELVFQNQTIQQGNFELQKTNDQIKAVFQKQSLIIVTNEMNLINNGIIEGVYLRVNDFETWLNNNQHILEQSNVCLTRVSYPNTALWREHEMILRNNNINYCELSGYNFEAYLDQILELLYTKESKLAW